MQIKRETTDLSRKLLKWSMELNGNYCTGELIKCFIETVREHVLQS